MTTCANAFVRVGLEAVNPCQRWCRCQDREGKTNEKLPYMRERRKNGERKAGEKNRKFQEESRCPSQLGLQLKKEEQ